MFFCFFFKLILIFYSLASTIEVAFSIDHFLSHSQVGSCFDTEDKNSIKKGHIEGHTS